jgi:predicted small metal-binding protein
MGDEKQVLDLAIEHAVKMHGHERNEDLVNHLREQIKAAPASA